MGFRFFGRVHFSKTAVPFRERWTGELINNDKTGVMMRLTRGDGKAIHEYRLSANGDMNGKAVNAPFTYRFALKKITVCVNDF